MTPAQWQRVKDLFPLALECDPATRSRYLDQACDGDADLRKALESLIADHEQVGSFIAEPAGTRAQLSSRRARRPLLPTGSQIGPYELVDLLGTGGMGEVYRARDPRLGREVALKVLPSDLAGDPERRGRFLREARMVSALNHPNICTIYEIGCDGGLDYICFEYIEGRTLDVLLEGAALSFERVLELAIPLVDALAYAHGKGILHRDLKPANIMVAERGPKLLDFGLAKVFAAGEPAADSTPSLTDAGLVMGTVAYMSPEQALGRKVDQRSDIFSFGTVLYELASGKQAFGPGTPTEVLDAVLHQEPVALARLRPELPADLSLVVEKALRKDAVERYQHIADLASDLGQLHHGAAGTRLIAAGRRRIPRAGIMAAATAAILGLVLLGRWRTVSPPTSPNSLAVMYFENLSDRSDRDNLGRMLTGLLTTDLASSQGLQVVSGQRLYDISRQLGKAEGNPDRTVATDVARRAGAAKMVLGQIARAGPRMVATVELVDVESGRQLGSYRTEGSSPQDVFSMAEGLGAQLRAGMTGRPTQRGVGSLTRQLTASADAYRAFVRGEAFFHRWELAKATEAFREAMRLDPDFALAHYRFSIAAWGDRGGNFGHAAEPEVRAAAERAAALKDRLPVRDRELVEGNLLYVTGRLSEAVPLLESALARDPDHKELLYLLSECYSHSPRDADPRRVAELLERLLELDPQFHMVYNHLVNAYLQLGEIAVARDKLDEWEARGPETVRFTRAQLSAYEGEFDEALRLSESPEGPTAIIFRGRYALGAGRWDIAQSMLQEYGGQANLLRAIRALLQTFFGEFDRAEAHYRELSPARLEADEGMRGGGIVLRLHRLAELLPLKGDLKAAHREAERALEVQPKGPYCLYLAGRFATRAGDVAGAERHLRTLEEVTRVARGPLVPHYRDALVAEIALARGRPSEARPLLENALRSGKLNYDRWMFDPRPLLRDSLARTYLAAGEKEKAEQVMEAFIANGMERVPHPVLYVRTLYTLGRLKLELGDRAQGRKLLREFLTHWGKADWDLPEVRDARARLAYRAPPR
jgi:serine/threonine-protein kinase